MKIEKLEFMATCPHCHRQQRITDEDGSLLMIAMKCKSCSKPYVVEIYIEANIQPFEKGKQEGKA